MGLNPFEEISLTLGILLVLSRLPIIISPNLMRRCVKWFEKIDCNLMALLGLLLAVLGLAIFYMLLPTVSFEIIVTSITAFILLMGAWVLVNNDLTLSMSKTISEKSDTWIRGNAFLGLAIGLAIIYIILYVK